MHKCAQCEKDIVEEIGLPSGKTIYVGVVPYLVDGKEVYLCSGKCALDFKSKTNALAEE